jgi:hypothetical protein
VLCIFVCCTMVFVPILGASSDVLLKRALLPLNSKQANTALCVKPDAQEAVNRYRYIPFANSSEIDGDISCQVDVANITKFQVNWQILGLLFLARVPRAT